MEEKDTSKVMEKLRKDIHFEPIGFGLLDTEFTMSELQRLYEAILGVQFDRRNFYKKMLQTGILDEVDDIFEDDSSYYGKNKEMRKMDIGALFGSIASEAAPSYSRRSADEDRPSSRRWGTKYRFNEKRYTIQINIRRKLYGISSTSQTNHYAY